MKNNAQIKREFDEIDKVYAQFDGRVPLTFKSLVIILPVEEIESVGGKIWLSREEGIFASETKAVQETDVESWQGHEREVNREFYFRQFSRLIGYRSLERALVIILPA